MAAVDKIYGNLKDAQEIRAFVQNHWQEIYDKTGRDVNDYLYYHDCWGIYNPVYKPEENHVISNFPEAIDACLVQIGNLPEPLQRGLEEQYDTEWFEDVKAHKPPYDLKPWQYEPATKFTFDWSKFKIYGGFKVDNALKTARNEVWVDAYYNGIDCGENANSLGEALWFRHDEDCNLIGWQNHNKELRKPGIHSSMAHVKVHSKKALLRWVRKMCFPKGTELKCSLGWVGSEFKIKCK